MPSTGNNTAGSFLEDLKGRTRLLLEKLEAGDYAEANRLIVDLQESRDQSIYRELGKLTRALHDALMNFHIDVGLKPGDNVGEQISQMADASSRLNYVMKLTEDAANKTMDLVDECSPTALHMEKNAKTIGDEWREFVAAGKGNESNELFIRVGEFLENSAVGAAQINARFTDILLAQEYQDLTGQVINRVIGVVQEVEKGLVDLVRVASNVDAVTKAAGYSSDTEVEPVKEKDNLNAEGPQVTKGGSNVVSSQDDVDDLLSSLGF